jgi:hypothetical protein
MSFQLMGEVRFLPLVEMTNFDIFLSFRPAGEILLK